MSETVFNPPVDEPRNGWRFVLPPYSVAEKVGDVELVVTFKTHEEMQAYLSQEFPKRGDE